MRLFLAIIELELVYFLSAMSGDLSLEKTDRDIRLRSYEVLNQFMRGTGTSTLHEKCGFPAVSYAINNREQLSAEVSSALKIVQTRPFTQKSILVGSFRVHYDTTGTDVPAMLDSLYQKIPGTADQFADSVAAIANYCEGFETKVLGYLPSPSDSLEGGGPEYDIYIIPNPGEYGATIPDLDVPNGQTTSSYITIDNSFQFVTPAVNKGMPALRVTLAHELHHSIQIGNYGYWTTDIYFYEITSTWMEDVVFTDVNDYYQYVTSSQGHFSHPEVPFNTANGFIEYSRAIWGHFIAKRFGRDAMRRTWEEVRSVPPLQAIDRALNKPPYASSFKVAFAEWSVWNYFTGSRSDSVSYYPEGRAYSEIKPLSVQFSSPSITVGGNLPALGSMYYNIVYGTYTSPLMVSNIDFSAANNADNSNFPYTLIFSNSQLSDSYLQVDPGVFGRLIVPDLSDWFSTVFGGGTLFWRPYPDPFKPDGSRQISFPVNSVAAVAGVLTIYASDMSLVYTRSLTSRYSPLIAGQVFEWNGITSRNSIAGSGVYFYFLQIQDRTVKGKFALLRK